MAEYLAPGVYMEEVDTGPKPIEGVSTSTAGLVGMAERGPVDIPVLVTSAGEYARIFGGALDINEFRDPANPQRAHCYLPYAVDGFFTNGGKRAYVVRVVPEQASRATIAAFDRGTPGAPETILLRAAAQGSGSAATYGLYVLDAAAVPAVGDTIRIGDGSSVEYREVANVTAPVTRHVPLDRPLHFAHSEGAGALLQYARTPTAGLGGPQTLAAQAAVGAASITVVSAADDLTAVALPWFVELSANGVTELSLVTAVAAVGADYLLTLTQPLTQPYPSGHPVTLIAKGATARNLETPASSGDVIVFADADGGSAGDIVELGDGTPQHEIRFAGALSNLPLAQAAYWNMPAGSVIDQVTLADDGAVAAKSLAADVARGGRSLQLNNRTDLDVGDVLRLGSSPNEEFVTIVSIPGDRNPAPDAGSVIVAQPVRGDHTNGTVAALQVAPAVPATPHAQTRLIQAVDAGDETILVGSGQGWVSGEFLRISSAGNISYHRLDGASAPIANAGIVELTSDLTRTHASSSAVLPRDALFAIEALDAGAWGNRLLVSFEDEERGLAASAQTTLITAPLQITVTSLNGIEAGTILSLANPATGGEVLLKVRRVDRANRTVTFDGPGLNAAALAALGPIGPSLQVRSREFRLTIMLRRRPDPAVPTRNDQIVASETFRHLSMDHRHSRYFQTVVGAIDGVLRLWDRRPEGESDYVRVRDVLSGAATEAVRLGPESLTDVLPGGVVRAARHPLASGDDSIITMNDNVYLGVDDVEPQSRTGLASLRNIPQVSLVAVPGQASAALQAGIIAHCELMRYRFAVLDADRSGAALADVQAQRQLHDTKYAALYYPWLTVPDPLPVNPATIADFPLPPSGHVLGVFARTDVERGVHKAPANEVIRGITGLTRRLSKSEQDILNPSPVNINVIRDFRSDNRGLRIWGARCITSDTDHKYVPVRRLLIFVEQSIEIGLQWVVFEPNNEQLWARVRRSISNFLTDVWRDGALEGTKPDEAFFVRCDRTTMTQTDIDNGRLICSIGVAPVKPAEFVIIRIGLWTANSEQ